VIGATIDADVKFVKKFDETFKLAIKGRRYAVRWWRKLFKQDESIAYRTLVKKGVRVPAEDLLDDVEVSRKELKQIFLPEELVSIDRHFNASNVLTWDYVFYCRPFGYIVVPRGDYGRAFNFEGLSRGSIEYTLNREYVFERIMKAHVAAGGTQQ
jgi:hypothetical protein